MFYSIQFLSSQKSPPKNSKNLLLLTRKKANKLHKKQLLFNFYYKQCIYLFMCSFIWSSYVCNRVITREFHLKDSIKR